MRRATWIQTGDIPVPPAFQSTLSLRRATLDTLLSRSLGSRFQSTLSLRRATYCAPPPERIHSSFQSTLSLRRATLNGEDGGERGQHISIHALLAESDELRDGIGEQGPDFNPRSPCGERHRMRPAFVIGGTFQSTLSLRRATYYSTIENGSIVISIHALLAESDLCDWMVSGFSNQFQSTLSLRRATRADYSHQPQPLNFNPRSPCGERRWHWLGYIPLRHSFQSTLSLRRATGRADRVIQCRTISIHALLAESDRGPPDHRWYCSYFNPRSPCGERLLRTSSGEDPFLISIHALLAESDHTSGPDARARC